MDLVAIRPLVTAAEAVEAVAAYAALDRAYELSLVIGRQGHDAHQAPHLARRRHHDLVVAEILDGREPDDARLWADVIAADDDRDRHQARYAASAEAVKRATGAVEAAVKGAGDVLLPWAARNRPVPSAWEAPDHRTLPWAQLVVSFTWPQLAASPAIDHENFWPRYTKWWPLVGDPSWYKLRDAEQGRFSEHCWVELAAGRYTISNGVLSFERPWQPERTSTERRWRPVVFLDPAGGRIA
jgi:hypothetical protein